MPTAPRVTSLAGLLEGARRGGSPEAAEIAAGYEALSLAAPSRARFDFASPASVDPDRSERGALAAALCAAAAAGRQPTLPGGGRLRLLAANLALAPNLTLAPHLTLARDGEARIDLLGLLEDHGLAVIVLAGDGQPPVAALIALLIGVAVVVAHRDALGGAAARVGVQVAPLVPRGLLVSSRPPDPAVVALGAAVALACGLELRWLRLDDAEPTAGRGGAGLRGHLLLRDAAGAAPRWPRSTAADAVGQVVAQMQASWRRPADELDERRPPSRAAPAAARATANDNDRRARARRRPVVIGQVADGRSGQVLAHALLAGLQRTGRLAALAALPAEDAYPAFPGVDATTRLDLLHSLHLPGETAASVVDAALIGRSRIFVEALLAEPRFALCANPGLTPAHPGFAQALCTGAYRLQGGRPGRCAQGAGAKRVWELLPRLFDIDGARDHDPCPLFANWRLVRNVLSVCLDESGAIATGDRHVLVVYDERNPAVWPGGEADEQWQETIRLLRYPRLLRRVSWQRLVGHLAGEPAIAGLVGAVAEKYDFDIAL